MRASRDHDGTRILRGKGRTVRGLISLRPDVASVALREIYFGFQLESHSMIFELPRHFTEAIEFAKVIRRNCS